MMIHAIMAIAFSLQWPIHQLDLKNAFLHDFLKEEVNMQYPLGFVVSSQGNFVSSL